METTYHFGVLPVRPLPELPDSLTSSLILLDRITMQGDGGRPVLSSLVKQYGLF